MFESMAACGEMLRRQSASFWFLRYECSLRLTVPSFLPRPGEIQNQNSQQRQEDTFTEPSDCSATSCYRYCAMERTSVFERICVSMIDSLGGDEAFHAMERHLLLLGCEEREINMFGASWKQAEQDCGSSSYPHTFSKQLLYHLRQSLIKDETAMAPFHALINVEKESLIRHRIDVVTKAHKLRVSKATLARAITFQRQRFRTKKLSYNTDSPSMLPLNIPGGCTWRCGVLLAKNGDEQLSAVACSVPRAWLATNDRVWASFSAMVEAWCACDQFVPPPLAAPIDCTRDGSTGDLIISFCSKKVLPWMTITNAAISIELSKSEIVLECWIGQMCALLVTIATSAEWCLDHFDTKSVYVSNGVLLFGEVEFSEATTESPFSRIIPCIQTFFTEIFGLSRTISVSSLPSKRVKFPLMQGCTLKLFVDRSQGNHSPSVEIFSILESSGADVDKISISPDSATFETQVLSSRPYRRVRLQATLPYDEFEIEIQIFPRPIVVKSVLAAEILATLEAIEMSALPSESLLCTAALSAPPTMRPDERLLEHEWNEILRKCVE